MSIHLITLGELRCINNGADTDLPNQKLRFALLVYLAMERSAPRDKLTALLWPDVDEERARARLKQTSWELRQTLGTDCLQRRGQEVVAAETLSIDARDFGSLAEIGDITRAVQLYRRPFLDGFFIDGADEFERWAERRRSTLGRVFAHAARIAIGSLIEKRDYATAIAEATRWLDFEENNEDAHRLIMMAMALAGRRVDALTHFEQVERRLREEETTQPSAALKDLADGIRDGRIAPEQLSEITAPPSNSAASNDRSRRENETPALIPEPDIRPWWKRIRTGAILATLILALIFGIAQFVVPQRPPERSAKLNPADLAILPFTVAGGPEIASFAASLHARLIDGLSAIDDISVISERGVRQFIDTHSPVDSIARKLGVGTLVDGRIEADGDSVYVRLQIVDGATGRQLAPLQASSAFPERITLMNTVADSIFRYLRHTLGPTIDTRRRLLETTSERAYNRVEATQETQRQFGQALQVGDVARAEEELQAWDTLLAEAERLDPHWAEPTLRRAALSEQKAKLATARRNNQLLRSIYLDALRDVERGLNKSPNAPRALWLRGRLRFVLWAWDGVDYGVRRGPPDGRRPARDTLLQLAERDLRAAIPGNPERVQVYLTLTELLMKSGRAREALLEGEHGVELDPYLENRNVFFLWLYQAAFDIREDEKARNWCKRGARDYPQSTMFQSCQLHLLAWTKLDAPVPDTAWALVERSVAGYPSALLPLLKPALLTDVAAVLGRARLPDSARAVLAKVATAENTYSAGTRAGVLLSLGDTQAAVKLLQDYVLAHPAEKTELARQPELRAEAASPAVRALFAQAAQPNR